MNGPDFIVTIHALERMSERFHEIANGKTDRELGEYIHGEVMDALEAGRQGKIPPLELAPRAIWVPIKKKSTSVVWTDTKSRGYVIDETPEGLFVLTVLRGNEREAQRTRLLKGLSA